MLFLTGRSRLCLAGIFGQPGGRVRPGSRAGLRQVRGIGEDPRPGRRIPEDRGLLGRRDRRAAGRLRSTARAQF